MKEIGNELIDKLASFSTKLIIAILIIVIGLKLIKVIMKKIKKTRFFNKLEKSSQTFIYSILNIGLKVLVFIIAISELGISSSSIITVLGSMGLALGLALQGGLSNIAGGVMIMIFKPFKVGDYIDTHDDSGTVKEINIFHTVLNTYDNKVIVIPNGELSNKTIVNYSTMKKRVLDIDVSVSYEENINHVKDVLNNIALNCKYRISEDKILIALKEHSSNALVFTFRIWVLKEDYWTAKFELLEVIKETFDKEGIEIPYQKLDVNIKK